MTENLTCPNCGAALERGIRRSKVVECTSCHSTVFLEDNTFRAPGESGELHGGPEFLAIGAETTIGEDRYLPVGVISYSYGRGWWDEFWCRDEMGEGVWVSVDEGDIVIERPVPPGDAPKARGLGLGASIMFGGDEYVVRESEDAECIAFRGELPEAPVLGEHHSFRNLVSGTGQALSCEEWEGNIDWHAGTWIDPFDVQVRRGTTA